VRDSVPPVKKKRKAPADGGGGGGKPDKRPSCVCSLSDGTGGTGFSREKNKLETVRGCKPISTGLGKGQPQNDGFQKESQQGREKRTA